MQAEQQREQKRFEAWYDAWIVEKRVHMTLKSEVWEAWQARASLSHPSTPQGWKDIESAPYETNVLAWLYLPKNPIASAPVIASRVFVEKDEPEHYGEYRRMVGCWWANGMYYPAGHVIAWMPLPPPPEQGSKG